jgi:TPP-dependent indolepyruvate ferredoxin oxidoreductase alpha subunit
MSDNLRRYRAIRAALTQGYPGEPSGRLAQHLATLAALISGIVGSKSSQLPSIAAKIPNRAKPESRVKRVSRWLDNEEVREEVYF